MNSRRGIGLLIIVTLILFAAGCAGSAADSAATEVAALAQTTAARTAVAPTATATAEPTATPTTTPIPSDTPTPTITPTATATETPSPTPTPIGGGNGVITFAINPEFERPPNDLNGIWRVRSDGSGLTQILSRPDLEELLGGTYDQWVTYFENHNQGYLWTGSAFHVVDEDWKVVRTIETKDLNFVDFSPDGSQVLFIGPNGQFHFIPVKEGEPVVVSAGADRFNNIHYSADGTSIYYSRGQGGEIWMINSDGSGSRRNTLDSWSAFTPHAGKPLGGGTISEQWYPQLNTFAVSPDRSQVAFSWRDLLFITGAENVELAAPNLVSRLPQRSDAELAQATSWSLRAESIHWSADMENVAVSIRDCINLPMEGSSESCGISVAIVRVADGALISQVPIDGRHWVCGFTPDSSQLAIMIDDYMVGSTEEGIYLVDFATDTWSKIVDLTEILPAEEQSTNCYYGLRWGEGGELK